MKSTQPFSLDALHRSAHELFGHAVERAADIRGEHTRIDEAMVLDCGINQPGSLNAGLILARLCLADHAEVSITPATADMVCDNAIFVRTDRPVPACLGGQYAGWPVSVGKFFAMASGPMRMIRGREEMLTHLGLITETDQPDRPGTFAVGVLESDRMPDADVIARIASDCGLPTERICLGVAPVTSIAGSVQVVARSVETALHKLHALDFDVNRVLSATGMAPIPPCAKPGDTVGGIGRTNDAMLYGAKVTLWIDADDETIDAVAAQVPSNASPDYGQPFAQIFKQYEYDFYKVDPMLFSPAVVTIHSVASGRTWRHGRLAPQILRASFAMEPSSTSGAA